MAQQVNTELLNILNTSLNGIFKDAFAKTTPDWGKIATLVTSTKSSNTYGWLENLPGVRKWLGDRHVNSLSKGDYQIKNEKFEGTIAVSRTDIEDDELGQFNAIISELANSAALFPDELVFNLLKNGTEQICYDGQPFFDTDHEVNGKSVSNFTDGTNPAWYLLNCGRPLKPLIFQQRTAPRFTSLDKETDDNVFKSDEYLYGVDFRCNAGYGFWQMARCSKAALTTESFNADYAAMMSIKKEDGSPLRNVPTLLVVPPSLRAKAFEIVNSEELSDGTTNPNKGVVDVLVSSELV